MTANLSAALLSWLLWLALVTAIYAVIIVAVDVLFAGWMRRRQLRRSERRRLASIDESADAAIKRIEVAYAIARRVICDEALAVQTEER